MTEVVKKLLLESNTLFDDIDKKLNDFPELKKMLYAMLFQCGKFPYNLDTHVINIGFMFGFRLLLMLQPHIFPSSTKSFTFFVYMSLFR